MRLVSTFLMNAVIVSRGPYEPNWIRFRSTAVDHQGHGETTQAISPKQKQGSDNVTHTLQFATVLETAGFDIVPVEDE